MRDTAAVLLIICTLACGKTTTQTSTPPAVQGGGPGAEAGSAGTTGSVAGNPAGDGDGDSSVTGDGDGDGDSVTGDGDGDSVTGDGDGDSTTTHTLVSREEFTEQCYDPGLIEMPSEGWWLISGSDSSCPNLLTNRDMHPVCGGRIYEEDIEYETETCGQRWNTTEGCVVETWGGYQRIVLEKSDGTVCAWDVGEPSYAGGA